MGLISLPVLNRLGYVNTWNVLYSNKFTDLYFFYYYLILRVFFSMFFIDFFLSFNFKSNKIYLVSKKFNLLQCNFYSGMVYLLKFQNWVVCYCNFFILQKIKTNKKKKFKKFVPNSFIFLNYYETFNLNYKFII
jgi:hypothetical protein